MSPLAKQSKAKLIMIFFCNGQTDGHSSSGYTNGLHSSLC